MLLHRTASTSDVAARLRSSGVAIFANLQTHGRGRRGRAWEAPEGSAVLCSTSLLDLPRARGLSQAVALAASDAIWRVSGRAPELKWPNDVLINGRKVGGVLVELRESSGGRRVAIIGIGLNANQTVDELPLRLGLPATSLAIELGRRVSRVSLAASLLNALSIRLAEWEHSPSTTWSHWRDRLTLLGCTVEINPGEADATIGIAEDVTPAGHLRVRMRDGGWRDVSEAQTVRVLDAAGGP